MSEVGPPVSAHGDSGLPEQRVPAESLRTNDGGVDAGGARTRSYTQAGSSAGQPEGGTGAAQASTPPLGFAAVGSRAEHDPLMRLRNLTVSRPDVMKIGLWGSPASGKSTFLAALRHATTNAHRSLGRWVLSPLTDESKELLIQWNQQLVTDRKFPEATSLGAEAQLRWRFRGQLAGSRHQPPWRRFQQLSEESIFDLDLIDVSGEVFGPRPTEVDVPVEVVARTLEHLADARGLIFLFDPISEREEPTVVKYMNRTLVELVGLAESRGQIRDGYLPQHISVCVTKFDDPLLFQQACRAGFVNSGDDGRPRVLDRHARRFFAALCEGTFWEEADERGVHGPKFVRRMLEQHFHPDRTRFYVTSSIGFNLRPDGRFDPALYSMVRDEEDGPRIIGPVEPINVLEPLVALHMGLRRRG